MPFAFAGYVREHNLRDQRVKNVYFTEQAISSLLIKLHLNIQKVRMFNSNGPSKLQIENSTNSYNHGIWGIILMLIPKAIISNCCAKLHKIKMALLKPTVVAVKYNHLLEKR